MYSEKLGQQLTRDEDEGYDYYKEAQSNVL